MLTMAQVAEYWPALLILTALDLAVLLVGGKYLIPKAMAALRRATKREE